MDMALEKDTMESRASKTPQFRVSNDLIWFARVSPSKTFLFTAEDTEKATHCALDLGVHMFEHRGEQ